MLPLPSWNGLHPLVVHFPIALLAVAPLLLLVATAVRSHRSWLASALLVMAIGTVGAWLAVASGEAASQLAERVPEAAPLLEHHEEMAETARTVFTVLTLILAALLALPWALRREPSRGARVAAHAVFLVAYGGAFLYLANTAHQGARLVHEMGVHAPMASGPVSGELPPISEYGPRMHDGVER